MPEQVSDAGLLFDPSDAQRLAELSQKCLVVKILIVFVIANRMEIW